MSSSIRDGTKRLERPKMLAQFYSLENMIPFRGLVRVANYSRSKALGASIKNTKPFIGEEIVMPKQSFALETGGEKRLEISWKGIYKDITVLLDGNSVGIIPDQKALSAGQEFRLIDGSTIKVQLVKTFMSTDLRVLRNGQPVPGSASDPQTKLKNAYIMVYFIAGLNLVLGITSFLFNVEFLQQIGIGFGSILFGLVFLVLGFFVQQKSTVALILAMVVFALDGILGVFLATSQGYNPGAGGIIARIFLIIPMFQGIGAIKALKDKGS
jgi:hypothetical protein